MIYKSSTVEGGLGPQEHFRGLILHDFAIRLAAASSDFRHFHPIFAGSHSTQATKASRPLDVGVIMAPNYDHPENTKIYNKRRVSEQKYSPQEIIHQPSFIN
jgi:hypothetical protein